MKGRTGKKSVAKLVPKPHGPLHMDKPMKHGGHVKGKKPQARADKRARGGGIHIKESHKGLLHKDTGTAKGKKIPEAKLEKAAHSSDPKVKKRAVFAENAKKWKH